MHKISYKATKCRNYMEKILRNRFIRTIIKIKQSKYNGEITKEKKLFTTLASDYGEKIKSAVLLTITIINGIDS